MPLSVDEIGEEARERRRQQVAHEVGKACVVAGLTFIVCALVLILAQTRPLLRQEVQQLWVGIFSVWILAAAVWLGWYHPPSRRYLILVRLVRVARALREVKQAPGLATREKWIRKVSQTCGLATQVTPTMAVWNPDLFFGRHQRLFETLDDGLRALGSRIRRRDMVDNLGPASNALGMLIQHFWDHPDEVSSEAVSLSEAFLKSVGGPLPLLRTKVRQTVAKGLNTIVKPMLYALAIFLVSLAALSPTVVFLEVSWESAMLAAFGLASLTVALLEILRRRQLD